MILQKKKLKPNQIALYNSLERRFLSGDKRVKRIGYIEFEGQRQPPISKERNNG